MARFQGYYCSIWITNDLGKFKRKAETYWAGLYGLNEAIGDGIASVAAKVSR